MKFELGTLDSEFVISSAVKANVYTRNEIVLDLPRQNSAQKGLNINDLPKPIPIPLDINDLPIPTPFPIP